MKRLWKDRRGNALAIAAGAFPLLVGAAGLAADTIQWTLWKRELQRAADSAALAGVYDRVANHSALPAVKAVVNHDLTINHHTGIGLVAGYPDVTLPPDVVATDVKNQVRVVLAVRKPLPFSSMFMAAAPTIIARSTAASVPGSDEYCVVALEKNAVTALNIGGSSAIEMDCGLISNSPSVNDSAINTGNASNVTASVIASVGGLKFSKNWKVSKYDPGASPADDPYAGIDPKPAEMASCAANPPAFDETTVVPKGTTTLCVSSLNVKASSTTKAMSDGTTLHDVTIYVTGKNKNTAGNVDIKGTMDCTRCTIILTNKDAASDATIGSMTMNANGLLNLSAPNTGKYKGIAVMQDRRAANSNQANKFNGGGAQVISGAIYFPSQAIDYSGNGTANAVCTRFVARRITFTGNSATSNKFEKGSNCPFYSDTPIGGGRRVRLVA